jgi:UDP-N-acetylmuramate--alanine ligase
MSSSSVLMKPGVNRIHIVGIGGIGMSAIARVLHGLGYEVSGSDARQTPLTIELAELGMTLSHVHRAENVEGADLVVVSSAVPEDNPEVQAAHHLGVAITKRDRLLGELMTGKLGIAVAGTHGKTTTSALIAFILTELGLDPTFVVGGILQGLETNARLGQGPHFVVEADEYDHTFLGLRPRLAVVTVIEMDHPDCFADLDAITADFGLFMRLVPRGGTLIGCADQPRVMDLLQEVSAEQKVAAVTYGLDTTAHWRACDVRLNDWGGSDFAVLSKGEVVGKAQLRLPGLHNVSNSLASLAVADCLHLPLHDVLAVLPRFRGVRRRFEWKGEARGVVVIDDYAHHPTEIGATLAAARRRFGSRPLWVFFQPHTYSRTKALWNEFAASFGDADHVLISDIYAAREMKDPAVSAVDLVRRMSHADVRYVGTLCEASEILRTSLKSGDVLLTLGAGDGDQVGEDVLLALGKSPEQVPSVGAAHDW